MTSVLQKDFYELLSKLRPAIGEMADALWLAALMDPSQTADIHAAAEALAAEKLGESYANKQILLEI